MGLDFRKTKSNISAKRRVKQSQRGESIRKDTTRWAMEHLQIRHIGRDVWTSQLTMPCLCLAARSFVDRSTVARHGVVATTPTVKRRSCPLSRTPLRSTYLPLRLLSLCAGSLPISSMNGRSSRYSGTWSVRPSIGLAKNANSSLRGHRLHVVCSRRRLYVRCQGRRERNLRFALEVTVELDPSGDSSHFTIAKQARTEDAV